MEEEQEGHYSLSTYIMWQALYHTLSHVIPSANPHEGFIDPIFTHKETRAGRMQ